MPKLVDFSEFERYLARFTNYERVVDFNYDRKTLVPQRMEALVRALEPPTRSYRTLHIAGTKGKGSTSLILEALLRAEDFHVGTYTSPHVEHLRERIRIAGAPVGKDELLDEMNRLLPYLEECQKETSDNFPTFFELITALAMACFRRQAVDWGIFEVGLGGRLDATNVIEPEWTAITNIGLEHTRQLGNSLREIAYEKAGIVKPRTPLFLGTIPPEAEEEVRRVARAREAPVFSADDWALRRGDDGKLSLRGVEGPLDPGAVRGPALRDDLQLAYALLVNLLQREGRSPRRERLEQALKSLELPARVEVLDTDPPIVLDGAHTVESIRSLRLTLDEMDFPDPRTLVFSIASDKRVDAIAAEVEKMRLDDILLTRADAARSLDPTQLRKRLGRGEVLEAPEEAFDEACRRGLPVVVTGSFYLAGRLRSKARNRVT